MQDIAASIAGGQPICQPSRTAIPELQRPSITAQSDRLALTPFTNPLQTVKGQASTPRSREEIRRLFTKKPTALQSASFQSNSSTHVQQPPSRLQRQKSAAPAQCHTIPSSGPLPGPPIHADGQHAGAIHQHSDPGHVQHQALIGPDADFQAPPSFRQFACPSSSLSAPTSGQRSSDHSRHEQHCTAAQRNSAPASGASSATCAEGPALPSTTASGAGPSIPSGGGPMMRAEILMGPAATIEVNVRFHANIAAALKK